MSHLSYITVPPKGETRYQSIPAQLKDRAEKEPDAEALIFYSINGRRESVTFSQWYTRSQRFARVLVSLGIKKGEKILIYMGNTTEWLYVVLGIMAVGAIPVSTFITRTDVSDLEYIIEKTNAVGMVFTGSDPSVISGIKRFTVQNNGCLQFLFSTDIDEDTDFLMSYKKCISTADDAISDQSYLDPDDIAIILRSSGSTGWPKLIALSHLNINRAFGSIGSNIFPMQDVKIFSSAAFSWIGGSPLFVIVSGRPAVTISGDFALIQAEDVLNFTEKELCNVVRYTNDVCNTIIEKKLSLPTCIVAIIVGGSPLKENFEVLLNRVQCLVCSYTSLETGAISEYLIKKGMQLEDYICGYPFPGNEIKIVGRENEIVMRGVKGRIFVRTPNLFLGYFGDAEMTRKAISPSSWYNTEDFGYISKDGLLYVLGRNGDCVTHNESTYHVSEIEKTIEGLRIPHVQNVMVVPVPDDIAYEAICVCVVMEQGHKMTEAELMQTIHEGIFDRWKPKYVVFWDSFPVNANGKLERRLITKKSIQRLLDTGRKPA